MRRLRLQGQNERLLREAVQGMLSEAGFGDVRAAEGRPEPKPGFGDLKTAERDQETRSDWIPPGPWDKIDWLVNASSSMIDIAGFALNFVPPGPVWPVVADAANGLCDIASLTIDSVQAAAAWGAYSSIESRSRTPEVRQMMAKDPAFRSTVETVVRAYQKNCYINAALLLITGAAAAASIAELSLKFAADAAGSVPTPAAPPAWLAGALGRVIGSPLTATEGVLKAIKFLVALSTSGYQLSTELSEIGALSWNDLGSKSTAYLRRLEQPGPASTIATAVAVLRVIDIMGFDNNNVRGDTIKAYAVLDKIAVKAGKPNPGFSGKASKILPTEMPSIDQIITGLT